MVHNKIIQDCREHFNTVKNSIVSLSKSMNYMLVLINFQIDIASNKIVLASVSKQRNVGTYSNQQRLVVFLLFSNFMNLSILSWNCQGCANRKFPWIFQKYNREFKPDIVELLETRVSGGKANEIIANLDFQYSHRVKAVGFS